MEIASAAVAVGMSGTVANVIESVELTPKSRLAKRSAT
jgi:hypothetical protein